MLTQYTSNALSTTLTVTSTTLNQAAAAGATGVRLTSTASLAPGDRLTIDLGAAGQEEATIASIPSPAPASPAPNVLLTAPLANAHAAAAPVSLSTVGATGLRLGSPFGFRAGQTLLVGPPARPRRRRRSATS